MPRITASPKKALKRCYFLIFASHCSHHFHHHHFLLLFRKLFFKILLLVFHRFFVLKSSINNTSSVQVISQFIRYFHMSYLVFIIMLWVDKGWFLLITDRRVSERLNNLSKGRMQAICNAYFLCPMVPSPGSDSSSPDGTSREVINGVRRPCNRAVCSEYPHWKG